MFGKDVYVVTPDIKRARLNGLALSMRNLADEDYIDARTLYRNKRYRGFYYHACQAVEKYFKSKNIPVEELKYARLSVDISSFKITKGEEIKEEGYGNLILSYLFSFLLYLSLIMMGSMVMQTVIQEKSNRIVEVLLSSVTSTELMVGKILGAAITGLLQMIIWISPIILVASTTWFVLPENLTIDITFMQVAYLLFNFFLGLLIFVGLFATVGSIFEDPQDAKSGMWPGQKQT